MRRTPLRGAAKNVRVLCVRVCQDDSEGDDFDPGDDDDEAGEDDDDEEDEDVVEADELDDSGAADDGNSPLAYSHGSHALWQVLELCL